MDMENKKKFVCIYMLRGMLRTTVSADTIEQLYDLLEMKEVVSGSIEGMSESDIINKIYEDSYKTTGRLTVYKLDENYDPETADEFDDEYVACRRG